jgi:hypothetical protein
LLETSAAAFDSGIELALYDMAQLEIAGAPCRHTGQLCPIRPKYIGKDCFDLMDLDDLCLLARESQLGFLGAQFLHAGCRCRSRYASALISQIVNVRDSAGVNVEAPIGQAGKDAIGRELADTDPSEIEMSANDAR